MAFPATGLARGTLDAIASGVFESVADDGGVEDIILKEIPMFYILEKHGVKKVGEFGPNTIVRVYDKDDSQPKAFTGLDTLSKGAVQAPRGAIFPFANYDINITIPWEDEINLSGANAFGDYVEEIIFKQSRSLGSFMSQDIIYGNQSDSKKFVGIEQAIVTKAHETTGDPWEADRWQFRQMTNTYGGVARSAWTSATAGGTNWENLSVDLADVGASPESRFAQISATDVSEALQVFHRFINCLTYEATSPDLILSDWLPEEDMNNASFGLQRISQGEKGDLDPGVNISRYKGMTWYASEKFAHSLVTPTGGTVPTRDNIVYVLNSKSWRYNVHKEANWAMIPFLGLTDQAGAIGRIRHRAQVFCKNPALNGVMYNYGG